MYMPGRSRTGSRPLRTVMSLAAYATRNTFRRGRRRRPPDCKSAGQSHKYVLVIIAEGYGISGPSRTASVAIRGVYDDPDRRHHTGAHQPPEPGHEIGFEEAHLGGPDGVVHHDREDAVAQRTGLCVGGRRLAHQVRPAAEHALQG